LPPDDPVKGNPAVNEPLRLLHHRVLAPRGRRGGRGPSKSRRILGENVCAFCARRPSESGARLSPHSGDGSDGSGGTTSSGPSGSWPQRLRVSSEVGW